MSEIGAAVMEARSARERLCTMAHSTLWVWLTLVTVVLFPMREGAAQTAVEPAFQMRRAIGITTPFGDVIRSATDRSAISPYYEDWDSVGHHKVVEEAKLRGFDTVRLVLDPSGLLTADEAGRQAIYTNLRRAVTDILGVGLKIVVDMHVGSGAPTWNHSTLTASLADDKFRRYLRILVEVARLASEFDPHHVAIELFNEPPPPCRWSNRPQWTEFQRQLFVAARQAAPQHTIVLTGPCWSSAEGLEQIEPRDYDSNTIYTFHFYDPFIFTYQGAWWFKTGIEFVRRLPYPPEIDREREFLAAAEREISESKGLGYLDRWRASRFVRNSIQDYFRKPMNREWLKQRLSPAMRWADRNGISRKRLWVGEFGTMRDAYGFRTVATEDRLRWFEDVRTLFDEAGLPWSVWTRVGGMGIVVGDISGPLDERVLRALGMSSR